MNRHKRNHRTQVPLTFEEFNRAILELPGVTKCIVSDGHGNMVPGYQGIRLSAPAEILARKLKPRAA